MQKAVLLGAELCRRVPLDKGIPVKITERLYPEHKLPPDPLHDNNVSASISAATWTSVKSVPRGRHHNNNAGALCSQLVGREKEREIRPEKKNWPHLRLRQTTSLAWGDRATTLSVAYQIQAKTPRRSVRSCRFSLTLSVCDDARMLCTRGRPG